MKPRTRGGLFWAWLSSRGTSPGALIDGILGSFASRSQGGRAPPFRCRLRTVRHQPASDARAIRFIFALSGRQVGALLHEDALCGCDSAARTYSLVSKAGGVRSNSLMDQRHWRIVPADGRTSLRSLSTSSASLSSMLMILLFASPL